MTLARRASEVNHPKPFHYIPRWYVWLVKSLEIRFEESPARSVESIYRFLSPHRIESARRCRQRLERISRPLLARRHPIPVRES